MYTISRRRVAPRRNGYTLVELMAFISIVGTAAAGVLVAYDSMSRDSADPVTRKQALAIAESLLEEVQQMPFTLCDPDDPAATRAVTAADCAMPEALGPEAGEGRYNTSMPFDNVNDYHGYNTAAETPTGSKDITGSAISGLSQYDVAVTVTETALGTVPASESLLIGVTVTGPHGVTVKLEGFRMRYAPRL
jgi:MSHA pilin protein MshD